ncbi:MAG: hypothetical protein ACLUYV_01150 [Alistipes shahii]
MAGGNSEGLAPRMLNTSIKNDASSVIGNGNSLAPLRSSGYGESSFRHHQPLSFGIAVRKEFAHGLSLESGVNYTLLRSDVRMQYTSDDVAQKLHFIGVPSASTGSSSSAAASRYIWVRAAWSRNAFRPGSAPRPSTNRACSGRRLQPWGRNTV